ncbi:MAG TPA: [protein-PII] uridylyltransferase [Rhodoferax sp.]|nr:[protein-PII] uridylyltransferase [Rhodoferax sp.]
MAKQDEAAPQPDIAALRTQFRDGKKALIAHFMQSRATAPAATRLIKALTRHVDATLAQLWTDCGMPASTALVAVGGFGRGELLPHSDVDVLLLLPDEATVETGSPLKGTIEAFITACWDIGLEVGSSVRTVAECVLEARADQTVQTALLESRLVCGARKLALYFQRETSALMDAKAFLRAKTLEMRQRHTKYEDTPYALEPNCKESPGGLRDLQVVMWVARAAGLGRNWAELAANGLITAFEVKQLQRNEGTLRLIRARLHAVAGRREDRLVFDLQTAVAESFGYTSSRSARSSEVLMHRYYWAAKAVTQLNQILMLNIEERINGSEAAPMRQINARFFDRAGMLEVARDSLYAENPHAILETFLVFQQTPGIKGLSARTLRALYNARDQMDTAFRHDPINRELFMDILRQPQGITHAFRLLNQTSVLGRYLWVFRRIVGRMQHDLFHVYTVDQHILMVLRNVRRFFMVEHAHEYPFCSQLAADWDKPWILYVAALFHDIAKGRGGDHSALGTLEVRRFCQQHDITGEDARLVEFLVREHLTMSRIAQKSDLSDPDVIANFAKRVGSEHALTALYLFTVADIRGTSPKVWNAWKGRLLEDLYRATSRALGGHVPDLHAEVQERQRDALIELALRTQPFESHKALWATLDVGYFMRHDAVEIAWHTRMLSRHPGTREPIVRGRRSPVGEGLQVLVYTPDQEDLFARICGFFDRSGFSILDARIHTSQNGYALDTFQVITTTLTEHYRELISMIEVGLSRVIAAAQPLPPPSRGRVSRRVKSFPITPRVSLKPDEKAQRWLLNISASDRVGLLYSVARVLAKHKINLQLAKITTLGERVEDTFLIQGAALQHTRDQIEIETELLDALA